MPCEDTLICSRRSTGNMRESNFSKVRVDGLEEDELLSVDFTNRRVEDIVQGLQAFQVSIGTPSGGHVSIKLPNPWLVNELIAEHILIALEFRDDFLPIRDAVY